MCCILFKWNKLRPLLQVAKLSVYNLSNKHVFYSGFCCCRLHHQKWHTDNVPNSTVVHGKSNAFCFVSSISGWAHQHEVLWTQWSLWSKVSHCWLLTLWTRFMLYRSKWKAPQHFKSCSSDWVCRHKSNPEPVMFHMY